MYRFVHILESGQTCFPADGPLCTQGSCVSIWALSKIREHSSGPGIFLKALPALFYSGIYLTTMAWKPLINRFKKIEVEEVEETGKKIEAIQEELLPLQIQDIEAEREGLSPYRWGDRIKDVLSTDQASCNYRTSYIAFIALPLLAIGCIAILLQGFDFKPSRNPDIEVYSIIEKCMSDCTIFNSLICTCQQVSNSIFCGQNNTLST